jgi:hypothetical protein
MQCRVLDDIQLRVSTILLRILADKGSASKRSQDQTAVPCGDYSAESV